MRLLALVTDGFGGFGGIAQYNRDFFSALASSSDVSEIVMLPRCGQKNAPSTPSKIHEKRARSNRVLYALDAVRVLLTEGPFDAVICGHLHLAVLSNILANLAKIPMWVQIYGIEAWKKPSRWTCRAVSEARLVLSISRYTRASFLKWTDLPPERVVLLPNALDKKYAPGAKPNKLIEQLGLTNKKVLLTVGRLSSEERYKGHERILRLLPKVLLDHPNLVYLIVGDGDDKTRLHQIAQSQGVEHAVIFVGGVPAGQLSDYYHLTDFFAMPSTGEGFGFVFLEAAACGLPILGGNTDGSCDALRDGEFGILVNPEVENELLGGLGELLRLERSAVAPLGLNAFSFERFAAHTHALIKIRFATHA